MREILDGLGDTGIELLRLEDWVDGFLRRHLDGFRDAVEPWSTACAGSYLEIRDDKEHPVLITADGAATVRRDLACCDPLGLYMRTIVAPPPPPCPVFG